MERRVREMLESRAREFEMGPVAKQRLTAPNRRSAGVPRRSAFIGIAVTVVASVSILVVASLLESSTPSTGVGSEVREDLFKLVDREFPVVTDGETRFEPSHRTVQDYVACMRSQGFDLSDATWEDGGWSIQVAPGSVNLDSRRWRTAAFVTCRLPGSEFSSDRDLVLGLSASLVDEFSDCMGDHGFELPQPRFNAEEQAVFDLGGMSVEFDSTEWRQAVFVDCWPGPPSPFEEPR